MIEEIIKLNFSVRIDLISKVFYTKLITISFENEIYIYACVLI